MPPTETLTLPAGLAFDATARRLQVTPAAAATMTYTYTLRATDVNESTATRDFTVTVEANPLTFGTATVAAARHPPN